MGVQLPNETISNVKDGLRKLHDMLEEFDKAERCGIPCQDYREFHKVLQENLTNIQREYGTPGK